MCSATSADSANPEGGGQLRECYHMRKVVGLGADGPSVMASDLNGVNGSRKQAAPRIHALYVPSIKPGCVAGQYMHSGHGGTSDSIGSSLSKACTSIADMAALQSMLATVYSFIQLSPTRLRRFATVTQFAGSRAQDAQVAGGSGLLTFQGRIAPTRSEATADVMLLDRNSLIARGLSEPSVSMIMSSWRESTQKQYLTYIHRWIIFVVNVIMKCLLLM